MAFPARVNVIAAATWSATTGTTFASTATSATTGNTLVVAIGGLATAGQTVTGVTDTAGNTYTKVDHVFDATDKYREEVWYAKNITGHASNVVTAMWSAAIAYRGIAVVQYSGLDASGPLDTSAKGTAAAGNTTVTTGTLTTTKGDDVHVLIPRWGLRDTVTYPTGFGANFSGNLDVLVVERFPGTPVVGTYTVTHTNSSIAKVALVVAFAPVQNPAPRVSQDAVELLSLPVPNAQATQAVVEVLSATGLVPGRVTQAVVEVLTWIPPPAGWRLTIGGADQTDVVDAVSMSFVLNERARMTVVVADLIPDKFAEIVSYAKDGYTPLFGGVILTRSFRGRNQYDPTFQCTLECGDYFTYADWTYTGEVKYDTDVTLKAVLTDLVDDYLATYGITLDPAQVTGPTLTPFLWRVKRVSDAIRELADRSGYVAVISPTKVLRMFVPGTEAAPFTITEAAPHAQELTWTDTSHTPATSVIVIAGPNGTREVHDERHHGDGANRIFPLYAPFVAVIGALSRSDEVGGYPLGICGVDIDPGTGGDYPYCYDVPTNAIHQRADQPVVPVGEYLWLWYLAEFPFQVSASCDSPLPFEIQRVEARPDVLSIPAAQQIAEGLVAASCADPRELAITTDEDGFAVGQALTVALATTRSIAGAFVITDVSMQIVLDTDQGDAYWVYQLKAIESTKYTGSYLDEWRRITTAPSTFVAPDDAVTRATLRPPRKPKPQYPPSGPKYLAPGPDRQATPRDGPAPLPADDEGS